MSDESLIHPIEHFQIFRVRQALTAISWDQKIRIAILTLATFAALC